MGDIFQLFTIDYVSCGFFYIYLFSFWGNSLLFLNCWVLSSWRGFQFCQVFSASIRMILFVCISIIWLIKLINVLHDWFSYVEPPLHCGINPGWSWCIILLACYWIQFPYASYPSPSEGRQTENQNHRKLTNLIPWTTALSSSTKLWAMPCRATQDGWVMVESSDKMWSTWEGNGKPLQHSCLENSMNTMKRQKDRKLKE